MLRRRALTTGFLAALAAGPHVPSAHAATCAGDDLRPAIEAAAPGSLARLDALMAENGDGRLWRVTSPGGAVSHLYGTMHVADPEIVRLGPEALDAFETATTVVIESTDILDKEAAGRAMLARPETMFFMDGTDLGDLLDDEEEAVVAGALEGRGMSFEAVRNLKPWVLAAQLALPACMVAGGDILDVDLARRAEASGREVRGLETALEQFEALSTVPMTLHVASLVDAARMGEGMEDVFATMGALYAEGRIGAIWPMMQLAGETIGGMGREGSAADLTAFEEIVITRRNHTMAERADPMLREGGAFVAVGALHLPGPEGLVALLREHGFEVERVAP